MRSRKSFHPTSEEESAMIHSFPSETAMLDVKEWGRAGEGNENEPARPATSVNALRTKRLITPRIKGLKVTLLLPVRVVKSRGEPGKIRKTDAPLLLKITRSRVLLKRKNFCGVDACQIFRLVAKNHVFTNT